MQSFFTIGFCLLFIYFLSSQKTNTLCEEMSCYMPSYIYIYIIYTIIKSIQFSVITINKGLMKAIRFGESQKQVTLWFMLWFKYLTI